jgi:hypothetical protein
MPLLDHFHAPMSERRNWEGFHGLWAAAIVEKLNHDVLAEEFFADMQVHIGGQVEVDVATLEEVPRGGTGISADGAAPDWLPPEAPLAMPAVFPDEIEVQVYATAAGAKLVAAVELVSPGNKDRPETRRAFAAKCASYLTRGIGLVVVDVVTNRLANLHNETVALLGCGEPFLMEPDAATYAVAYRPCRRREGDRIELWPARLRVGEPLPLLPLPLLNAGIVPLDLEATYATACGRSRLPRAA